jgi:hypothetical protein
MKLPIKIMFQKKRFIQNSLTVLFLNLSFFLCLAQGEEEYTGPVSEKGISLQSKKLEQTEKLSPQNEPSQALTPPAEPLEEISTKTEHEESKSPSKKENHEPENIDAH